ncbi:D-glycero-alpha-D-manno-heptose-1,7-bisphosphate 7-phosphatase [Streptomyces sp. KHY 26]|uniref:D-glycero-alpha-D-manno-heptose-1,7-bisphosphate 7-phosphatase n=1 Tax=Streptomyces sp. KHY 26 TaxID=3097359 RepID=UPI00376EBE2D
MTSVRPPRAGRESPVPRPAVFLDRDGTLTEARHYPTRPSDLVLQPGIGPWLRTLREVHGAALVVVTNQSGLARALFTDRDLEAMHRRLRDELASVGVELDGIYTCPHHVDGVVPELARRCPCRKPEPGMLLRAATELRLDLARSWMIGDFATDVEAGHRAGCRTAWVGPRATAAPTARTATTTGGAATTATATPPASAPAAPTVRAATTAEALREICRRGA